MSTAQESRHLKCSICSQIRDQESAVEYVHNSENNTDFPEAVKKLKTMRNIKSRLELMQCPECGTFYLYRIHYEFLIGYGGSYDEYFLWRLTDEIGRDYLEGRLSTPPSGMF